MTEEESIEYSARAEDIANRSIQLLEELEKLRTRLVVRERVVPGIGPMIRSVEIERKNATQALQRMQEDGDAASKGRLQASRLTYSNLPALEMDWSVIKRYRSLASISQDFWRTPKEIPGVKSNNAAGRRVTGKSSEKMAFVDAAVDGGCVWVRILNITEKRLLHQMAESGWDWGAGDDSDTASESDTNGGSDSDGDDGISIVRILKGLVEAARTQWCKYRHPRLHLLLTRVEEGRNSEIDKLIKKLRGMGGEKIQVTVDCANSQFVQDPPPPTDKAISNLVDDDLRGLPSTLVVDTSVLIALASDITHTNAEVQPWHRGDVKAQIKEELAGKRFLQQAMPVLRSKKLVCTRLVADHFHQIISTIASKTEVERASLMLPLNSCEAGRSGVDTLSKLQKLSDHPLGTDLMFPIEIVKPDQEIIVQDLVDAGSLPRVALAVEGELLDIPPNHSTFLYAWKEGMTAITSNGTLVSRLERFIEENRTTEDERGPSVFVFPFNRALTTKGRRTYLEKQMQGASSEQL